jgi:hypothetical protein
MFDPHPCCGVQFSAALLDKRVSIHRVTIRVYEALFKAALRKSTVLLSISNNECKIANEILSEVNLRLINIEVALFHQYV